MSPSFVVTYKALTEILKMIDEQMKIRSNNLFTFRG
jgi:hypothetical protein